MKRIVLMFFCVFAAFSKVEGQCPYLTGALIDGCNYDIPSTGDEGDNEIVFLNSGSQTVPVQATNTAFNLDYGTTNPPATNYVNTFVANAATNAYLANLNAAAGCALFQAGIPGTTTIPANTSFWIMNDNFPKVVYNFSSLCGSAPIYLLFSSDADWTSGGNFSNSATTPRFFETNFPSSCNTISQYTADVAGGGDINAFGAGGSVSWGPAGGAPSLTFDVVAGTAAGGNAINCANPVVPINTIVLPVLFLAFEGHLDEAQQAQLRWTTNLFTDHLGFFVERAAAPTGPYYNVGLLGAAEFSQQAEQSLHYRFTDTNPVGQTSFYRIAQHDFDGQVTYSSVVEISPKVLADNLRVYPNPSQGGILQVANLDTGKPLQLSVHNQLGQCVLHTHLPQVTESQLEWSLPEITPGLYVVTVQQNHRTEHIRWVVQ